MPFASENPQGKNPRAVGLWVIRECYGDLGFAAWCGVCDLVGLCR